MAEDHNILLCPQLVWNWSNFLFLDLEIKIRTFFGSFWHFGPDPDQVRNSGHYRSRCLPHSQNIFHSQSVHKLACYFDISLIETKILPPSLPKLQAGQQSFEIYRLEDLKNTDQFSGIHRPNGDIQTKDRPLSTIYRRNSLIKWGFPEKIELMQKENVLADLWWD